MNIIFSKDGYDKKPYSMKVSTNPPKRSLEEGYNLLSLIILITYQFIIPYINMIYKNMAEHFIFVKNTKEGTFLNLLNL